MKLTQNPYEIVLDYGVGDERTVKLDPAVGMDDEAELAITYPANGRVAVILGGGDQQKLLCALAWSLGFPLDADPWRWLEAYQAPALPARTQGESDILSRAKTLLGLLEGGVRLPEDIDGEETKAALWALKWVLGRPA